VFLSALYQHFISTQDKRATTYQLKATSGTHSMIADLFAALNEKRLVNCPNPFNSSTNKALELAPL
jgi:hypothetical protein